VERWRGRKGLSGLKGGKVERFERWRGGNNIKIKR
jgi:hypothetical protein